MLKRLREVRWKSMMTQGELSRRSGVPQPVIQCIESGKTQNPRIDTVASLAKALGTSIDDLIRGDNVATTDNQTSG